MKIGTYHCHSIYCDGKNSIEEMITSAISQKLSYIGFSSHSIFPFASTWHLSVKHTNDYFKHIRNLGKQLENNNIPISVFAGLEADFIPQLSSPNFVQYEEFAPDYIIESTHYLAPLTSCSSEFFTVDGSTKELYDGCKSFFKGDKKALVCFYYETIREMLATAKGQIVGHLDLIKKNNDELKLFNEEDSWYIEEIEKTIKSLKESKKICEINTGGIARKKIDELYPSPWIINLMKENDIPIVINSDAHSKDTLVTAYDRARQVAQKAGYTKVKLLEKTSRGNIWTEQELLDDKDDC